MKLTFSTKLTENAFKNLDIDFIGKRKIFYVISGIIIVTWNCFTVYKRT